MARSRDSVAMIGFALPDLPLYRLRRTTHCRDEIGGSGIHRWRQQGDGDGCVSHSLSPFPSFFFSLCREEFRHSGEGLKRWPGFGFRVFGGLGFRA